MEIENVSMSSHMRWSISVISKGPGGPDSVVLLEMPKMIKKVLQYVREPKWAILELLKHPKTINELLNNQENQTQMLNSLAVFGPY